MANAERVGPKVQAEKAGTADQGGGQLVVNADTLEIRGRLHSRRIGSLFALRSFRFLDPAARHAELTFEDLSCWSVVAQEDGLLEFARDVEGLLGRSGVLVEPPRMSEHVREAMGSNARRRAMEASLAIPLGIGCRVLVGLAAGLGWAILASVVPWVGLLGMAVFQREPSGLLGRVRELFERRGWALTLVLPMALGFGAVGGMRDAAQEQATARHAQALSERLRSAERAREAAQAEADAQQQRDVAQAVQKLHSALGAQQWEQAESALAALEQLAPEHPALPAGRATLAPQLQALRSEGREAAVRNALRNIRRMQHDAVVCDDAAIVAASWKALGTLATSDPRYSAAIAGVPTLERCRRIVAKNLAANTNDLRRQQRARMVPIVQDDLRRAGFDVRVELAGKASDELLIAGPALDRKAVAKMTDGGSREPDSFLDRRQREGARVVRFLSGKRVVQQFALRPEGATQLAQQILTSMELGEPLELAMPDTADAPPP